MEKKVEINARHLSISPMSAATTASFIFNTFVAVKKSNLSFYSISYKYFHKTTLKNCYQF